MEALVLTENFIRDNDARARDIVRQRLQDDSASFADTWGLFDFTVNLRQELLLYIGYQTRWAIENDIFDVESVPDCLPLFHIDALEAVKPEAVTIIR